MTLSRILYRTWRVLRRVLLTVVALVLACVAALWWVNRHDDPLRPEVAQALRFEPPSAEAMRGNGYFTLLGLGAPPSEDAFTAGQRFFAAQMRSYELYQRTGEIKSFIADAYSHQAINMASTRCTGEVDDCYAHYLKHADAIRSMLAAQAPLIERYLSLLEAPTYEEVLPPYFVVDFPYYPDIMAATELVDMRAALLLADDHLNEALALLEQNAQLHKRLMAGSRTLIGAMIALAADTRQQRLIGSALRHLPALAQDHDSALRRILEPAPTGIIPALEGELRYALGSFQTMPEPKCASRAPGEISFGGLTLNCADRLLRPLAYLPHVTLNQAYRNMMVGMDLARLPADQLDRHAAARGQTAWPAGSDLLSLRNAWGNVFLRMGSLPTLYVPYIERIHDIEGHRRLLRLQIAALHESVPPEQMTGWLAAQPPELRNPYTLQPMGWDTATQSLLFEGRQPQPQNPEPRNVYRVRLAP